jgi:solute carrier family 24 (sodium/potassium/calcium exchanger), member 6
MHVLLQFNCLIKRFFLFEFVLFIGLGVTADTFFCPSLRVIADSLSISQNIAGVTFLAFGNGAPDVFSAIAAIGNAKDGDAGLAFGALFGAGVFVSTVVAGSICLIKPFTSVQRPFLRDLIFFLISGFWAFVVIWDGYISLLETLGFLFLYFIYIIVVVFGRYINQRIKRWRNGGVLVRKNEFSSATINTSTNETIENDEDENGENEPLLFSNSTYSEYLRSNDIKEGLKPFSNQEWSESNWFLRLFLIVKIPVLYFLKATIPLVDYEAPNHNWNKFVIILNCITAPTFMAFATKSIYMTYKKQSPPSLIFHSNN